MQKTLALILKKQNIGETDRIVTVFSPTLGKKRVVARAVRKPLSKLAGHLDTFMVSQLMLTDETELPKVTSAVLVEPFEQVRRSLVNLDRAFAVSRIVERVILEDVNQQAIFQLTLDALARLNDERPWPNVWLYFLGSLTNRLGLSIHDYQCAVCARPMAGPAVWQFDQRQFVCVNCPAPSAGCRLDGSAVKLLRLLQTQSFQMIGRIRLDGVAGGQVEEVLLREITEWFAKPWVSYAQLRPSGSDSDALG